MKHYSRLRHHDPDEPVGPDSMEPTRKVGAKYEPHVGETGQQSLPRRWSRRDRIAARGTVRDVIGKDRVAGGGRPGRLVRGVDNLGPDKSPCDGGRRGT